MDEQLEAASWNLEPLVEGGGPEAVETMLNEARTRAEAFAERYRGRVGRARRGGAGGGDARAGRDQRPRRARGLVRRPQLLARHGGPRARRAAPEGARARRHDRDPAALLRPRVERGAGRACRGAARGSGARIRRPPPADAAPLPPAPALRARGARAHRDERHRRLRVPAPLHGADLRSGGAAARPRGGAGLPRGGPLAPAGPGPRTARRGRRRRDRVAAAGPQHARVRLQHAAPGQGHQGPAARLPALAGVAQPRERGERRVGAGADRGGPGPLRPRAPLVRAEGEPPRPRQARLLRPHGAGVGQRRPHPLRGRRGDRARLLPDLLAGARPGGHRVLHGRLHRRTAAPGQARRRLLLVHGALARTRT